MALGVHVVVHAVGFIGFRDGDVHGLMGFFGGADDQAASSRRCR